MEIVRAAFAAFIRGDTYGHAGVLEAFAIWPEQWDEYRIEPPRVVADPGDYVIVAGGTAGRGKQSGVEVEMEFAHLFTVREGRLRSGRSL